MTVYFQEGELREDPGKTEAAGNACDAARAVVRAASATAAEDAAAAAAAADDERRSMSLK
jgi:hypothetical protein